MSFSCYIHSYSATLKHGPFKWELDLTQDMFVSLQQSIKRIKGDASSSSGMNIPQDQIDLSNVSFLN